MDRMLKDRALSVLFEQLALLLAGGESGAESLAVLAGDMPEGPMADTLKKALADMDEQYLDLAAALKNTGALPDYACNLLQTGQNTGRLQETCESLAAYYDARDALTARLRGAVVYPLLLLLFMCVILLVLAVGVLPVFEGVYASLAGSLTAGSLGYLKPAKILSWAAFAIVGVICVLMLVGLVLSRIPAGKKTVIRFLQKFPFTAPALRRLALARVTGALCTLIGSGLTEEQALAEAAPLAEHSEVYEQLKACESIVCSGESMARAFYEQKLYEPLYGRMLLSGSKAGRLEDTLAKLSRLSVRDAEERVYELVDGIEPLLTGFLTISVGAVLLSVMLPLAGILAAIG